MTDIMMVFVCLNQSLHPTALRQLMVIAQAMLTMTGRVTMLGLSRWAGKGGSYRTIQRFFNTTVNWSLLQWVLIRTHLWKPGEVMVAAGDDVIVTKSGKCTHGLDRFFSSIYSKVVPGLGFLSLSLISVKRRVSYPVVLEQLEKPQTATSQEVSQQKSKGKGKSKGKPGRRKGSKNHNRRDVELSPYLQFVQHHLKNLLELIGPHLKLEHFVFDGAFGNNDAVQMVRQVGLHLISKLRHDSALYLPYHGPYSGRGPRKKYGDKINYQNIPETYLKTSSTDKDIETKIYQMKMWHKKFADLLNVVVIVKTNLKTHKVAHVVLFSSDLDLSYDLVIDYYRLRFQIEIVQTQMTKWCGFAFWPGGHDIADFHLRLVDDNAIDEQFDQLPALGKRQVVQSRLQTLTKRLDSFGQRRYIDVLLGLGIELSQLLRQSLLALRHLLSFALELFTLDHLSQV
jgi:putative transposase